MALQLLYLNEFSADDVGRALHHFWREGELAPKVTEFVINLVEGTIENTEMLDRHIAGSSEHWRLDRMALIDRNIMRMSIYEFIFTPETPKKVIINEAIEIAKRFSTEESTQFINGILDNVRKKLEQKTA